MEVLGINNNELILKAKSGDNGAKEKILENFKAYIVRQAMNYKIKNYDIEDVIQECNISILNAIKLYDINKNCFTSYILKAIRNSFNAIFRKAIPHYENEVYSEYIENINEESIDNILDEISFNEIIKDLKEDEKIVLIYFYLYNFKLNDIAEILNINSHQCFKSKRNAIKKLKEKFRFKYNSNKYCFK